MKVTYYLEVLSSWCFWAEPAWAELKARFAGQVEFDWKIALMTPEAYPATKAQCQWFYRRSGTVMRSPFMLNSDWFEPELRAAPAPSLVAEAAKDFGMTDDRVRLAIATAALRQGQRMGRLEEAAAVGAAAAGVDTKQLLARAQSKEVETRVQASTAEFKSFQIDQRPAFLLQNAIGDRVIFSGVAKASPLAAAIEGMLEDEGAYASYAAHFGSLPPD
jgi:predicted DsbA family dithiol-disulfide isomerase